MLSRATVTGSVRFDWYGVPELPEGSDIDVFLCVTRRAARELAGSSGVAETSRSTTCPPCLRQVPACTPGGLVKLRKQNWSF